MKAVDSFYKPQVEENILADYALYIDQVIGHPVPLLLHAIRIVVEELSLVE